MTDLAIPLQLVAFKLAQVVVGLDRPGDDVLPPVMVVGLHLRTQGVDQRGQIGVQVDAGHLILRATLRLPVLRALALALPGMGAVVFIHLGLDHKHRHVAVSLFPILVPVCQASGQLSRADSVASVFPEGKGGRRLLCNGTPRCSQSQPCKGSAADATFSDPLTPRRRWGTAHSARPSCRHRDPTSTSDTRGSQRPCRGRHPRSAPAGRWCSDEPSSLSPLSDLASSVPYPWTIVKGLSGVRERPPTRRIAEIRRRPTRPRRRKATHTTRNRLRRRDRGRDHDPQPVDPAAGLEHTQAKGCLILPIHLCLLWRVCAAIRCWYQYARLPGNCQGPITGPDANASRAGSLPASPASADDPRAKH